MKLESSKILVAEDDPDSRSVIVSALEAVGYDVHEAINGTEAVRQFDVVAPDLVVLDVMMPELDGLEVCKQIKMQLAGGSYVPVLLLTARDSVEDKVLGLGSGADDYLTKPFNYQELQARVRALLRVRSLNLLLMNQNKQLAAMQQQLVEKERQLLATQLAGSAAHKLGQPLSAILLNCHLLKSASGDNTRCADLANTIKLDAERIVDLLKQLIKIDASKTMPYSNEDSILKIDSSER